MGDRAPRPQLYVLPPTSSLEVAPANFLQLGPGVDVSMVVPVVVLSIVVQVFLSTLTVANDMRAVRLLGSGTTLLGAAILLFAMLTAASKEIDEVKADRDAKAARIVELEGLAAERQTAAEKLTEELAKSGAMKEKYDFSKASSRESASTEGGSSGSVAATAAPSEPFVDPLLSFVQKAGSGSGRIGQSSTGHGFLGNSGPSSDGGIAAAIRGGL